MLDWKRTALAAAMLAGIAGAQPALTTVQDILYLANGTRFNGTMYITYGNFQAGDTSDIATANLTVPIVNGVLSVQLAPTTTASAGAQYSVVYNSGGINQFSEIWAVPPSTTPLRVRNVLVSTGDVVGPQPVTTTITISEVTGLQNELAVRPMEGVSFTPGRAAVIDASGLIDGAAGNLSDCVRVDGSSGPCGTGSGGGLMPNYSDGEVPQGTIDGNNTAFTLLYAPSPAASLSLYRNGLFLRQGADYTVVGNQITFFVVSTPQPGDLLVASYRYANPSNPLGSLTQPQVVCSAVGNSTSATSPTSLGTCTLPAGLMTTGDRLEVQYQFTHSGSASGFTATVNVGSAGVVSRAAPATESLVAGHSAFGTFSGGQVWDTQSWGGSLSAATAAGTSAVDITQALQVNFQASLASSGTDTVTLSNFTVVRYPAQTNP